MLINAAFSKQLLNLLCLTFQKYLVINSFYEYLDEIMEMFPAPQKFHPQGMKKNYERKFSLEKINEVEAGVLNVFLKEILDALKLCYKYSAVLERGNTI